MQQRRDDAVGGARDPTRVCRTPVSIFGMQIERVAPRGVVCDDRAVHMHRTLGCASRATGEMQQRRIIGRSIHRFESVGRRRHQLSQVQRTGLLRDAAILAYQ